MRKALDFKALLLLILVVFSNGRFYSPEFQDVDTFQSKARMNRQVATGILINLQYINKYILNYFFSTKLIQVKPIYQSFQIFRL